MFVCDDFEIVCELVVFDELFVVEVVVLEVWVGELDV